MEITLSLKQEHDQFLMEAFQKENFTIKQLQKLNQCRIYLSVETLADITDGSGNQISKMAYDGKRPNYKLASHHWAEQVSPNTNSTTLAFQKNET